MIRVDLHASDLVERARPSAVSFAWIRREPKSPLAEVTMFYRALTTAEEKKFRKWARDNYEPGSEIKGLWHPIVQEESVAINRERSVFVLDAADS